MQQQRGPIASLCLEEEKAIRSDAKEAKAFGWSVEMTAGWPIPATFNFADDVVDLWAKNPERTAATILAKDGREWFQTGDNVEIDADGYFFYTGRADDIINSSGYRIGPQEVENALSQPEAVQECAVAGVLDETRGELVKAWITLAPRHERSEDLIGELQDHTKRATAPYKHPSAIEFVTDLPKTTTGKIRRNILRESAKP